MTEHGQLPVTDRTRVRRLPDRQQTDREQLYAILDEALIAHVGIVRDGLPVVIPFAIARDGGTLLLHGSTGAGLLRPAGQGAPICVTVTLVDALVVARSTFDHSMNYRSVVAYGIPEPLEGEAKVEALALLTDHLLPGRWDEVRPSTKRELAATVVLRLSLDEASVKVRDAPASSADDDGEDRAVWAGLLPLRLQAGDPIADPSAAGVEVPASVRAARAR